ncbi:hypothetical protein FRB96_003908 [Tulasnella sp. 330]|nr:hypothetical protein FRB96_003908 [Tulasnella sp. 330]KAG8870038.1 hypothetical protein FRB98_001914 [Tulasnella sp. 332]KAG8872651.1 hypothetical protein FRB97_007441 [Tulasnella sp. 331]
MSRKQSLWRGQHELLESFVLYGIMFSDTGLGTLSLSLLQPPAACKNLQVLDVSVDGILGLMDDGIESLVSHLPSLLNFVTRSWDPDNDIQAPLTTLHSLATITTSCSKIKTIALRVHVNLGAGRDVPVSSGTLASVDVLRSRLTDPTVTERVALFFSRLSIVRDFHIFHKSVGDYSSNLTNEKLWDSINRGLHDRWK